LAKVNGGCGCCNYYQLYFQINSLKKHSNPSVVFAEYSGTCNNLIDSLLNPFRETTGKEIELANFSTFVDARLLLVYLKGAIMPLSIVDKYIWERHVKEAEILIVNKIDLLSQEELEILKTLARNILDSKKIIFQNSKDIDSVENWIKVISNPQIQKEKTNDSGAGETGVAWLDEEVEFTTTNNTAGKLAYDFIKKLTENIVQKKLSIEHLQFFLSFNGQSSKISYTSLLDEISSEKITIEKSNSVDLMVNARVQTSPEELRKILYDVLNKFKAMEGVAVSEKFISYFQP
jgi:G3E family GTPase